MKKGFITVTKTKNYFIILVLENGKKQNPPHNKFDETFLKELPMDFEVFYELHNGSLETVCLDEKKEKIIFPYMSVKPKIIEENFERNQRPPIMTSDKAHAPYNFVPLNDFIVPDMTKDQEKVNGYIDIEIITKTPLFIRGIGEKFFGIDNPIIPGSSLRGMIRTLVEIASYSEFKFTDKKKKFFYRNISDDFYLKKFIEKKYGKPPLVKMKVCSGWLCKTGKDYLITPSIRDSNFRQYYRTNGEFTNKGTFAVMKLDIKNSSWVNAGFEVPLFDFNTVFFDPLNVDITKHKPGFDIEYWTLKNISRIKSGTMTQEGCLVASGPFARKKHYQWVINNAGPKSNAINVTSLIDEYKMDDNRENSASLIELLKRKTPNPVPCFYLVDSSNRITAVGHTGIFRLAYQYNVIALAEQKKLGENLDFADSMFGTLAQSGKVAFEDAVPFNTDKIDVYSTSSRLKVLQTPRPTSFQHYVEQPDGVETAKSSLDHWGTNNAKIRGYKLYWHRNTPEDMGTKHSWAFNTGDIDDLKKKKNLLSDPVRPVKAEQHFIGRIRFADLSKVELGCLLFVLNLPPNCCHKIGMGKPLGLGTVKIKPELTIIDLQKRYSVLVNSQEKHWEKGAMVLNNFEDFLNEFAVYMNEYLKTSFKNYEEFWRMDSRMKELKKMLFFDENYYSTEQWLENTQYMEIDKPKYDSYGDQLFKQNGKPDTKNEYENRPVLPKPTEYVNP